MAMICPTVTAREPHEFREQMERLIPYAHRIHIDLTDGVFTPEKLVEISSIWWPVGVTADIHLMYQAVIPYLDQIIEHKPNMVIVQAEAAGTFHDVAKRLHDAGIKVGVALLADTPVKTIEPAMEHIDHVLIFSGDLGHFGGHAQMHLLSKVRDIRKHKPAIEIGWDGGINEENAYKLVQGGIDVLNVGGAIQRAPNPQEAYAKLEAAAKGE